MVLLAPRSVVQLTAVTDTEDPSTGPAAGPSRTGERTRTHPNTTLATNGALRARPRCIISDDQGNHDGFRHLASK
uniref:Secreted protein n=1 Tax=Mesocestoides corti TaxID=53468 RepID=A0A5K3FMZ0_MESCO